MKATLSKDHVLGRAGDEVDVTPERHNYLSRVGVIETATVKKTTEESEPVETEHTEKRKPKKK